MGQPIIACVADLLLVAILAIEASPYGGLHSQWASYKARYGKHYADEAEETKRLELFTKNRLSVERFNKEQSKEAGYTMAVNRLSDRTEQELKQLLGPPKTQHENLISQQWINVNSSESLINVLEDNEPVPEAVDWRAFGRVSPVKFQGLECGTGWVFAAIGMLEGQLLPVKRIEEPMSLSAQNIMDCGPYADPCMGGDVTWALSTVAEEGGVESQSAYPYKIVRGSCKYNKSRAVIANKGSINLPAFDEDTLKRAVAKFGPVAATIYVNENFMKYKSGVFMDKNCLSDRHFLNHAVLIVGFGTDPERGDYWIVKNSWSDQWGEGGYARMARNQLGMCGISTHAVIATF